MMGRGRMGLGLGTTLAVQGGVSGYTAENFVLFDGTNDYMDLSDSSTAGTDNGLFLLSTWLKTSASASNRDWIGTNSARLVARIEATTELVQIIARNSSDTVLLSIKSDVAITNDAAVHVAFSCDLSNAAKRMLYIDGVDTAFTVTTYTSGSIDWTTTDNSIGATNAGANKFNGGLQEVYLTNEYLDLDANIGKLISGGKPVDLGADGSTPTGTQPLFFCNNAFGTFNTNKGSAGNYTVKGALADEGTSPSD